MQRVTRSTAVAVPPAPPAPAGPPGYFTGGNPSVGLPATIPGFEWFNAVQEELIGLILRAGLTPDAADVAQVRRALDRLHGGGLRSVTANTTLTADDAGLVLVDAAGGNRTITLPAANAAGGRPMRLTIVRTDSTSANSVTIQRAGADLIEGRFTLPVLVGQRLQIISDGASAWRALQAAPQGRMQVFSAGGTFTVPDGVFRIKVRLVGGGAGGGRGTAGQGAAGGGAGGYAEGWYDVAPGQAFTVTIGSGGAGATTAGSAGSGGGSTSFGALLSATGGVAQSPLEAGGGGGAGTGGQINAGGGPGLDAIAGSNTVGGAGGNSAFGGGGRSGTAGGVGGGAPGAGGGGSYGGAPGNGGNGAAGIAIVEW